MPNVNVFNVLLPIHYAVTALLQLISFFIIVWQMMLDCDNFYNCCIFVHRQFPDDFIIQIQFEGKNTFHFFVCAKLMKLKVSNESQQKILK